MSNDYYDMPEWDFTPQASPEARQAPTQITDESATKAPNQGRNITAPNQDSTTGYRPYVPSSSSAQSPIAQEPLAARPNRGQAVQTGNVRVAVLLPLSGPQGNLGKAMLNTAQMALFDVGVERFELMPFDTKGTGDGAREAATQAIEQGAQLILGPVFANSVRAAKSVVRYHNVNMIAFSTDWSVTSSNVFIMGFLPFDQIDRVITYALDQGMTRIAAIAPQTTYGRAIISAYQALAQQRGIEVTNILTYDPQNPNLSPDLRQFTHYDARMEEATSFAEALQAEKKSVSSRQKARLKREIERIKAEMEPPFEAVLIAAGGESAVTISNLISHYDLPPRKVKRLGIGLFDDPALANEFALRDSWFSAPSTAARLDFDGRYKALYKTTPPRLATLAYDATALAAVLARSGLHQVGAPNFNRMAITNPNGFAGVDGIFRFLENGTVERGLAILSFDQNKIIEIDPAPATFQ